MQYVEVPGQQSRADQFAGRLATTQQRAIQLDRLACLKDPYSPMTAWLTAAAHADTAEHWRTEWKRAAAGVGVDKRVTPAARYAWNLLPEQSRKRLSFGSTDDAATLEHVAITVLPTGTVGSLITTGDTSTRERIQPEGLQFEQHRDGLPLLWRHDTGQRIGDVVAVTEPSSRDTLAGLTVWARITDPWTVEELIFRELEDRPLGASYRHTSTSTRTNGMQTYDRSVVVELSLTDSPATMSTSVRFGKIPPRAVSLKEWNKRQPDERRHPAERAAANVTAQMGGQVQVRSGERVIDVDAFSTEPGNTLGRKLAGVPRGAAIRFADGVILRRA